MKSKRNAVDGSLRAAGERPDLVFPFGYGLSYTTFAYSDFAIPCTEVTSADVLDVTATVTNTGSVAGDDVTFLFWQALKPRPTRAPSRN